MFPAFLLTVAVEVPLWTAALVALRSLPWRRAAVLGVLVNVLTHPVLWWSLGDTPSAARFLFAEAAVVLAEAAVLFSIVRRDAVLLLVASTGVNAASIAAGMLIL